MTWCCCQTAPRKAYGSCFVHNKLLVWRRVKSFWLVASRTDVRINDDFRFLRQGNLESIRHLSWKSKCRGRWIWVFWCYQWVECWFIAPNNLCLLSLFWIVFRNVLICAWFGENERYDPAHIFNVIHEHFITWPESNIFFGIKFRGGRSGCWIPILRAFAPVAL